MRHHKPAVSLLLLLVGSIPSWAEMATLRIGNAPATPAGKAVTTMPVKEGSGEGVVRFDLAGLPKDAKLLRAELLMFRTRAITGKDEQAKVKIEIYPLLKDFAAGAEAAGEGKPLELLGPWFDSFDATAAVKDWQAGKANGGFFVKAGPLLELQQSCLDVAYEAKGQAVPEQVKQVKALHRAGQTFITWKEIEDVVDTDDLRWTRLRNIIDDLDKTRAVRYSVYRHDKPITAGNLHQAARLARVAPLSGWNVNGRNVDRPIDEKLTEYFLQHHQWNPFVGASVEGTYGTNCKIDRLAISDGAEPLPRGSGLYVHTLAKDKPAAAAYYAVVTSVDGVENTKDLGQDNCTPAIQETAGEGEPVLQKEFPPKPYFNYREKRLHYVTWVAPPYCNVPSQYYNWAVGLPQGLLEAQEAATQPAKPAAPAGTQPATQPAAKFPIELSLHRDGRSHYRTQYRLEQDSIVLSPHDFPVATWWYGYHEALGTLRPFSEGAVHDYTQRRLLRFMDWASAKWPADRNRVCVTGAGGAAGAGAMHLGLRNPDVFSLVVAGYPMVDYVGEMQELRQIIAIKKDKAPKWTWPLTMEALWGKVEWGCKTAGGVNVWDEMNLVKYVNELPEKTALPLVAITGTGMLKPMHDFYVALLNKSQPFTARYGVYGGGLLLPVSRTGVWSNMILADTGRDQALPAFYGPETSSLNQLPKEPAGNLVVSDGIKYWWGVFHTDYRWKTLADEPGKFEMEFKSVDRAGKAVVGLTLRRIQNLRIRPDWEYSYEVLTDKGDKQREGKIKPVEGVWKIPAIAITPEGVKLVIHP